MCWCWCTGSAAIWGRFYASTLLTDPKRSVEARLAAGHIVETVDLAPRLGLIFAAPTGLALAVAKGWLPGVSWGAVIVVCLASCVWAVLAVVAHLRHGAAVAPWAKADRLVRYGVLSALTVGGAGVVSGLVDAPLFIGVKLLLLAVCVALGLGVRMVLAPFGPAVAGMIADGASPETNAVIASAIGRVRPMVVGIWVCLIAAAALGVATPA